MLNSGLKYFFLFIFMVLLQVLVFNNIRVGGYANPQVYIFFILVLPFAIKGYLLLFAAFGIGLVIDVFTDSLAIHTASSVLLAFCRPGITRLIIRDYKAENIEMPGFSSLGVFSLFLYCLLLILIHHSSLFFLEIFRFDQVLQTMTRTLVSSGLTFVFVLFAFALLRK